LPRVGCHQKVVAAQDKKGAELCPLFSCQPEEGRAAKNDLPLIMVRSVRDDH
jgi:hypothetical protein